MENDKALIAVFVTAILVGAFAIGGTWYYMNQNTVSQDKYNDLQSDYYSAQSTISNLQQPAPEITLTIDNSSFAGDPVNASDDVAADTWENHTITIDNSEDSSQTFRVTMDYPTKDKGLPSELESKYFETYVYDSTSDATVHLFNKEGNAEYWTGWTATIPAGGTWTRTLSTKFNAVDDEFADGTTHDASIYLVSGGDVVDTLDITIST